MEAIGPLQLRVMRYIWDSGPSTVHQVHEHLNGQAGSTQLAYTTILTVMRNLSRRSILDQRPNGRSHIFAALVSEDEYKQAMLRQMADDLFNGDFDELIAYVNDHRSQLSKA